MDIHEYQAKIILKKYGVPVPDFIIISSNEELVDVVAALEFEQAVIKVQIHAGGRGKGGGVKIARSKNEIIEFSKQLLGKKIITPQTGPQGIIAEKILISPLVDIKRELYLGVTIDRKRAQITLIASPEGGVEIEEVADKTPHKILTIPICNDGTIRNYNLLRLTRFMGWQGKLSEQGKRLAQNIAKAFIESDASLIEINPLAETVDGDLLALDAKISIDDNALFRHPTFVEFYDPSQSALGEAKAKEYDLAYVALDGNIGCIVNGAGLAMATMDLINLCGGKPANFLDVGGGASEDKIAAGFTIIISDPQVKSILVNIFGGIMNCEVLSAGMIVALKRHKITVPVFVRMEGTNVEKGKALLENSGLDIYIAKTLTEAAEKAVAAS